MFKGDSPQCQQADVVCLRAKDLTSFAWQVSDALCYLASHQFVHKDIAARNVLITRALTAKLGDYGLCHSLDPLSALHESPQGKVPLKWTAIEAIKSGTFSEKSDVYVFFQKSNETIYVFTCLVGHMELCSLKCIRELVCRTLL